MSKAIQAIPTASVAKICSGQVILDLSTAVKELVENALDAGASSVEVRLREHGLALIEVSSSCCCWWWWAGLATYVFIKTNRANRQISKTLGQALLYRQRKRTGLKGAPQL